MAMARHIQAGEKETIWWDLCSAVEYSKCNDNYGDAKKKKK